MKKKVVVLISVFTLFLGLAIGASAAPIMERITANLDWSASFELGGQEWIPQDTDGNKFAPINYNGYNYLPVRAVSEALDVAIGWDQETRTIILGERTDLIPLTDVKINHGTYSMSTTDKQYTVQGGKDYTSGVVLSTINSATKAFRLVPDKQYQTIELDIFALHPENDIDLKISDEDGVVLKHLTLSKLSSHESVTIDIGGKSEIKIEARAAAGSDERIFVTGHYK